MLPKHKYPAKGSNITSKDVDAVVESLGGYERSETEKEALDAIDKKHGWGKHSKKDDKK